MTSRQQLLLLILGGTLAAVMLSQGVTPAPTSSAPLDAGTPLAVAQTWDASALGSVLVPDGGDPRPFCTSPGDNPVAKLPETLMQAAQGPLVHFAELANRLPPEEQPLAAFLVRLVKGETRDDERPPASAHRRVRSESEKRTVDLYSRGLARRAWRLLAAGRTEFPQALVFANRSVAEDDTDPVALVVRAIASEQLGHRSDALTDLRRAFEHDPLNPLLALGLARRLALSGDSAEALSALAVYRADSSLSKEQAEAAERLAKQLEREVSLTKDHARVAVRGVTVLYPETALPRADAEELAAGIADALDDTARLTATTRRAELTAVAYATRADYLSVTCAPMWSVARFDGVLRLHLEPTRAERHEIYRHEAAHAQMAATVGNNPRWFAEGLADYVGLRGKLVWTSQLRLMLQNQTWIPFSSLSSSLASFDAPDSGLAYSQSDAMVHFLAEQGGPEGLARAVRYLGRGGDPSKLLSATLGRQVEERELLEFLERKLGAGDSGAP